MTQLQPSRAEVAPRRSAPAARRRGLQLASNVGLGAAALIGVVVLLAALAPLFGFQVVRLATGSMTPAYPAGSVVLVRDVPAESLSVGDVATIVRGDGSPVTHRVVEVTPIPGGASIRMRGDANEHDDPSPYVAKRVGLVLGGVPAAGYLFAAAEHPSFAPVAGLVVAGLVLWTWWPERRQPAHRMPTRTSPWRNP